MFGNLVPKKVLAPEKRGSPPAAAANDATNANHSNRHHPAIRSPPSANEVEPFAIRSPAIRNPRSD